MVLVHNEVASLYLVQLLERQRQFSRPCPLALEIVFVEAVKNLVVSKDAHLAVVIHKSLVQSLAHRSEYNLVVTVIKNDAQTLNLLCAIA